MNIIKGIKNIVSWVPVIWKDRDWDQSFFYKILRFKLYKMKKYFETDSLAADSENIKNNIGKCIDILDRLIEDDYASESYKKHDEKWGEIRLNLDDGNLEIDRKNVLTEKDREEERYEFFNILKEEHKLRNDDINSLFDLLKKNVEEWWD